MSDRKTKSAAVAELARTLGVPVIDVKLSKGFQPRDLLGQPERDYDDEAEAERYQREIEA